MPSPALGTRRRATAASSGFPDPAPRQTGQDRANEPECVRRRSVATDKRGRLNSLRRRFRLAISTRRVAVTMSGLIIEIGRAAPRACPAATSVSMGPITREGITATTDVQQTSPVYFV